MRFAVTFMGSLIAAILIAGLASSSVAGDRPAKGAKLGRSPVLATRGMVAPLS